MRKKCYERLAAGWRKLIAAAGVHEDELPQLGAYKEALEEALEDATTSKCRQVRLKAKAEAATQEVNDNVKVGREAARRLRSFVKANFSRSDERLASFGIKSWGRPRRKPKPEKKAALPDTTPAR